MLILSYHTKGNKSSVRNKGMASFKRILQDSPYPLSPYFERERTLTLVHKVFYSWNHKK